MKENRLQLEIVSYSQAEKLDELGYPKTDSDYCYKIGKETNLKRNFIYEWDLALHRWKDNELYAAPYIASVENWLKNEYDIIISKYENSFRIVSNESFHATLYITDTDKEDAFNWSLDYVLKNTVRIEKDKLLHTQKEYSDIIQGAEKQTIRPIIGTDAVWDDSHLAKEDINRINVPYREDIEVCIKIKDKAMQIHEKDLSHIERLREGKLIYRGAKMCMTKDIGVNDNLFGGFLLALLDEMVLCFACEVCDTPRMVTKKLEEVTFTASVKVGQIIKVYIGIDKIGNTSITFNVEARKYNVYTEKEDVVCHTKMVFVRVDEGGNAIPISERIKTKYTKTNN